MNRNGDGGNEFPPSGRPPVRAHRLLEQGRPGLAVRHLPAPFAAQVYTLSEARIVSTGGVVALGDVVIEDTLDHTSPELDGYRMAGDGGVLLPPRSAQLGRCLSLLLGGHTNHFHCLVMNLGRLGLLASQDLRGLAAVLVPDGLGPVHRDALARAGLGSLAPLRPVRRAEHLAVEELVLPWDAASGEGTHPAAIAFLRSLVPRSSGSAPRRIYVDRRAARARPLVNEAAVVEALSSLNIVPVALERLSFVEQASLFQDAALVVAPHGAGLANIVFCRPGARVIELVPSGARNECYRHLAAAAGLEYARVDGPSLPAEPVAPLWAPWTVAMSNVLAAVNGHPPDRQP